MFSGDPCGGGRLRDGYLHGACAAGIRQDAVWVLAECVRFENRTGAILKNGLSLMLLHIPASLGILGILAAGVLTIYLLPVTILVMPGVMVWFITMLTESVFRSHMTPEERREYDERNRI